MEMGREHMLGMPCPTVLPDEQDTDYGHVYCQEEKK